MKMFKFTKRQSVHPDPVGSPPRVSDDRLDDAQVATFAAGCFWGVEAAFREIEGVLETRVGYTGGQTPHPSYEQVCGHGTGHAEAIEVTFDSALVSYKHLLETFWRIHDPTTPNRQGLDIGSQYRSAIFVHDEEQASQAAESRDQEQANAANPIVTEITRAGPFYEAEGYHQRYFEKQGRANCAVTLR
jgi:methionine-S-sulfoxide reductase